MPRLVVSLIFTAFVTGSVHTAPDLTGSGKIESGTRKKGLKVMV